MIILTENNYKPLKKLPHIDNYEETPDIVFYPEIFNDKTIEKEHSEWLDITVKAADLEQNMIITLNLFWAGYGDGMLLGARGGKRM